MNAAHRPTFFRSFGQGALIVLAAAALTYGLHRGGFFERWENNQNVDRWLRFKQETGFADKIVLVLIDDADYRSDKGFRNVSPLKPGRVLDVIEAIAKGEPDVIGVDLDTTQWTAEDASRAAQIKGKIVWARDGWEDHGAVKMEGLLGGFYSHDTCFGLPAVLVDDDGVVRRYSRAFEVAGVSIPSFPTVVAGKRRCPGSELADKSPAAEEGEGGTRINFLGPDNPFRRLTSSAIVTLANTAEWKGAKSDVYRKIVLLGGVFRAARDRYVTPVGLMDGVVINAHIVQGELSGANIKETAHETHLLIDIALGLILVAIFYFVDGWRKLVVILAAVAGAIFISFWLLQTSAYFFSFVPILGGVLLHEFIETVVENQKLRDELKAAH